jgi:hypothetical protein
MKTSILAFLMLFATGLFAQTDITNDVVGHIKTGNVKELVKHFADNVDLEIEANSVSDIVSRAQAEQILKKFFEEYKPTGFVIKHSGKSKLGVEYRIGELTTVKGTMRITMNLHAVGDIFQITLFEVVLAT